MEENKKRKKNSKNGFTLVELIVVIVIILILAAVLVPTILRYIEKAREANCKADAATVLMQVQADGAEFVAAGNGSIAEMTNGRNYYVNGVLVLEGNPEYAQKDTAMFSVDDEDEIGAFGYSDGKYTAIWRSGASGNGGWKLTKSY